MWLTLQHKVTGDNLTVCVCYLPPLNSSSHVDAESFFVCLMTSICEYQNKWKMYICGDFNSRCGDMLDFIEGVDVVNDRNVIDVGINKYEHLFI